MNTPKAVIGLIGEQWSGKDTFAKLILQMAAPKKVEIIRFSAILTETLNRWSIPSDLRKNRRMLFEAMNEKFGKNGSPLVNVVKQQIIASCADVVILNSLKQPDDIEMVREFRKNVIVYVTATFIKRYERRQISKGEPMEIHGRSYDDFAFDETDPGEILIRQIGQEMSDVTIHNNDTMEKFVQEVEKFYAEKIAPIIS